MLPLIIAEDAAGKAVAELQVSGIGAAQPGSLHQIVGKEPFRRETPPEAETSRPDVHEAFACIAPFPEQIHPRLAAGAAVGIQPAPSGEDPGEIRTIRIPEGHGYPGLKDPVSLLHPAGLPVHRRPLHGMGQDGCHGCRRTGGQARIPVQHQEEYHVPQAGRVSRGQAHPTLPSLQEVQQIHDGSPFPFPAPPDPVPGAPAPVPAQEAEAAAVLFVQPFDLLRRRLQDGAVPFLPLPGTFPQVCQDPQEQVFPRIPVGQTEAFHPGCRLPRLLRGTKKQNAHPQGSALRRDAPGIIQPGQPDRAAEAACQPIRQIFAPLQQRQQGQEPRGTPKSRQDQTGEDRRREQAGGEVRKVPLPARLFPQGAGKEIPSHVFFFRLRQQHGALRGGDLGHPPPQGQAAHLAPVCSPALRVHPGIDSRRVPGQDGLHRTDLLQQGGELQGVQDPDAGEHRLRRLRVAGQPLQQAHAQGAFQQSQLRLLQIRLLTGSPEESPQRRSLRPASAGLRKGVRQSQDPQSAPGQPGQPFLPPQRLPDPAQIPAHHIEVIQEPFRRRGRFPRIRCPSLFQGLFQPGQLPECSSAASLSGDGRVRPPLSSQRPHGFGSHRFQAFFLHHASSFPPAGWKYSGKRANSHLTRVWVSDRITPCKGFLLYT